jgi:hypothetical protein
MLGNLLGNFFDKEAIVRETIVGTLDKVAFECGCNYNELFIMIKPFNDEFNFKCYIYCKLESDASPKLVREIPLSEILGDEKKNDEE